MWPTKKDEVSEKKSVAEKFMKNFPSISSLIINVTNLTVAAIDGEQDLNENDQQGSSKSDEEKNTERKLVPDPQEFALSAYEVTQESPTYKQYKKLNPSVNIEKKRDQEEQGEAIILDSPPKSESPKSEKSNIIKKIFKGKNKSPEPPKPEPKAKPTIVIQPPDSSSISENISNEIYFNKPSTSKQMFIPFDEFVRNSQAMRKKVSPFSSPLHSPDPKPDPKADSKNLEPEKKQKVFINIKNKNKKRALRKQMKNFRVGLARFGNRILERGIKFINK